MASCSGIYYTGLMRELRSSMNILALVIRRLSASSFSIIISCISVAVIFRRPGQRRFLYDCLLKRSCVHSILRLKPPPPREKPSSLLKIAD